MLESRPLATKVTAEEVRYAQELGLKAVYITSDDHVIHPIPVEEARKMVPGCLWKLIAPEDYHRKPHFKYCYRLPAGQDVPNGYVVVQESPIDDKYLGYYMYHYRPKNKRYDDLDALSFAIHYSTWKLGESQKMENTVDRELPKDSVRTIREGSPTNDKPELITHQITLKYFNTVKKVYREYRDGLFIIEESEVYFLGIPVSNYINKRLKSLRDALKGF
jgi:hypothetical protein